MNGITLLDFQENCSNYLVNYCFEKNKDTLVVKSPTGSGKTIILLDFIDNYFNVDMRKTCFIWLTPGSGELEEQSMGKMNKFLSYRHTKTLDDILNEGFTEEDVCFINWERVTKRGNKAIVSSERKNLYERISEAHHSQIDFIIIIDEEHSHNTSKARDIIDAFAPIKTIRVSATAQENSQYDFFEINETQVINSGLITKSLYINENIMEKIGDENIDDENEILIDLAIKKRCIIAKEYEKINENINPLIIIQFPNENEGLIASIENILNQKGINYENKLLSIRMSNNHKNFENIEENDNITQVLLIKQAIATGWDCPRAKILVKLRENMGEQFEIQTLGRLRRMPKAKHYDNPILDNAFLYTFDEKYTEGVRQSIESSFFVKRIFLKPEFKDFKMIKQLRNLDYKGVGDRETYYMLYEFLFEKYNCSKDFNSNINTLTIEGYDFSKEINRVVVEDVITKTDDLISEELKTFDIQHKVNTTVHGFLLLQTIDSFKNIIGMNYEKTKIILEKLFRNNNRYKNKLFALDTESFYAFVINNKDKIKEDLREAMSSATIQERFVIEAKASEFKFPENDILKYSKERDVEVLVKNNYRDYTDDCLVEGIRSKSERLFERYCQNNDNIKWYYKNGDSGQNYFSIVYLDGFKNQHLFYADYILETTDNEIWVIETKGGEYSDGTSKNIDLNVKNKFLAFKSYAEKYGVNWGFVRDRSEKLYFNNTEYSDDMFDENWRRLKDIF